MTFPTSRIIKTFIHVSKALTNTREEITANMCGVTFEKLCKHEKKMLIFLGSIFNTFFMMGDWLLVSEGKKLIYFVVVVICLCELKIVM